VDDLGGGDHGPTFSGGRDVLGDPLTAAVAVPDRNAVLTCGPDDAMTALISRTSFDSLDAHAMSVFWGQVFGFVEDPGDPNEPGHEECMIFSADGSQRLLFIQVPDAKQVKNRLPLDLKPAESTREQELERLLGLGAREVADRRRPDGSGWVVLADPEGNESCILRSDAERGGSR
jgi:hypothetical protein